YRINLLKWPNDFIALIFDSFITVILLFLGLIVLKKTELFIDFFNCRSIFLFIGLLIILILLTG
ncbi:hypothetical protein, partial [Lysinibacillus agricola]|uniref:hypothetical protein n=1 Tax=Lysinibacillus agricola TaxID=2590012 RepID=UPI003C29A30F